MNAFILLLLAALLLLICALPEPPFKYCNVSSSEISALKDLYESTQGDQWIWYRIDGVKWSFSDPHPNPCHPSWQGILCDRLNVTSGFNCSIIGVILYTCSLKGPIPETLDRLPNLIELDLYNNYLNGSIPASIGNLTKLEELSLNQNLLTGSIPNSTDRSNSLRSIDLASNSLTGELPKSLLVSNHLQYLLVYDNKLTGTVDSIDLPRVVQIDFSDNYLEGEISSSVCYKRLQYLALSSNLLTGSLPTCIYALLFYVDLSYNSLIGNLEDSLSFSIEYLILNNNQFSGTIPVVLQESKVSQLIINNNLFTGPVPIPSADLVFLYVQNNLLSGSIVATNWTNTSIAYVDLSNNEITGSLPAKIFTDGSQLVSFAASSNCITGRIPTDICNLESLLYLGLDGLSTAKSCRDPIFPGISILRSFTTKTEIRGGVPDCLFSMKNLETLHLSGNSILWSFQSDLSVSDKLKSMSLSHNKITGSIPDSIQLKDWTSLDLSYNKLVGYIHPNVALQDNSTLVLQVNRLSGKIPNSILSLDSINILTGNLFYCNLARDALPVNDVAYKKYQCGSNSFNQASIVWVCLLGVTVSLLLLVYRKRCLKILHDFAGKLMLYLNEFNNLEPHEQLYTFRERLLLVLKCVMGLTVLLVLVFLPLYAILTRYYKTSQYQYAWTVSAAFLSGATPAIVLWFFFSAFLVLLFSVWVYLKRLPLVASESVNIDGEGDGGTVRKRKQLTWRQLAVLIVLVLLNCILMSLVNGAYILVILNCTTNVALAAQILTALFKLLWNDFGIRYLMNFSRRFYSAVRKKELDDTYARQEMPYMTFIVLFNCIIAPCLATAAVDSDCFYDVFVAPSAVASQFPIVTEVSDCFELGKANHTIFLCGNETQSVSYLDVSYDPPFIYSYQCSSSILTNYASVYVYMFLMVAFLKPISLMLFVRWHGQVPRESIAFKFIDKTIYNLLKPPAERRLKKRIFFHSERLVLRSLGKLAVFLTFGLVFPPLAVVLCVAFFTETYLNLMIIGRFLVKVKETPWYEAFREKLNRDCQDSMHILLLPLVRLVVPFAACFYAFFVFDIYGDNVGFRKSIWAPVLLIATPLLIWIVYSLYEVYERKSEDELNKNSGRNCDIAGSCSDGDTMTNKQTELIVVVNALQSAESGEELKTSSQKEVV